jgi:hypothetical protein
VKIAASHLILLAVASMSGQEAPKREVSVIIFDCYSAMRDVSVSIDGRAIEISPPTEIDDTTAICGGTSLAVGEAATVTIARDGDTRQLLVPIGADAEWLWIEVRSMAASSEREAPLLD